MSSESPLAPTAPPRLSIIITNYNYAKFVAAAIDSVLSQDEPVELIVVDDCSTDNSRDVIGQYADRVIPVFQEVNRGHGAGFNAGFSRATSELVMFLDADDCLLPGAIKTILSNYEPEVAIYHYRMRYMDEAGALSGIHPSPEMAMAEGDISEQLRMKGRYVGTITSGLVFSRQDLVHVMPMDPEAFRQGGDGYLSAVVPLYGASRSFETPVSGYRLHGSQHSRFSSAYAKRSRWCIGHDAERYRAIREHAGRLGLSVAADLGAHDPDNIHERLVSMLFASDEHPVAGDSIRQLASQSTRYEKAHATGLKKLFVTLFWGLFALAPKGEKQRLMRWKIDAKSRPAWMRRAAKRMRRSG
ncbi:MAG: glycosyltransferase family 2 protein [Hyphomonas sp.]|uniref:glycosyltransferase family 2 protein n=1 Tax=Hyphomonas sp. TaxID=87 RepID=UPI003001C4E6